MAKTLYTPPLGIPTDYAITVIHELDKDVDNTTRNLRDGPTTLYSLVVANDDATEQDYVKAYDNVSSSLVSGTTPPDIIVPIIKNATGATVVICHEGLPFVNGLSLLAATTAGNANTASPTGTPDAYMSTSA